MTKAIILLYIMIGIIGAMTTEIKGLVEDMQQTQTLSIGGTEFYCGTLSGKQVVVALSGIGKVNASMTTSLMLAKFPQVGAIINIGVAGGIAKGMRQGDMILATKSVQHDIVPGLDDIPLGQVPGFDFVEFDSDAYLIEVGKKTLQSKGVAYHVGIMATGDEFVKSDSKAQFLASHFGAIGCDMETAAIAHVCHKMCTKFLSIRSVSDSGDNSADLDFNEFVIRAAQISIACAEDLVASIDESKLQKKGLVRL